MDADTQGGWHIVHVGNTTYKVVIDEEPGHQGVRVYVAGDDTPVLDFELLQLLHE